MCHDQQLIDVPRQRCGDDAGRRGDQRNVDVPGGSTTGRKRSGFIFHDEPVTRTKQRENTHVLLPRNIHGYDTSSTWPAVWSTVQRAIHIHHFA